MVQQVIGFFYGIFISAAPDGQMDLLQLLCPPEGCRNVIFLERRDLIGNLGALRIRQFRQNFVCFDELFVGCVVFALLESAVQCLAISQAASRLSSS